jgi:glucose-6-phosphate dehydrogenase assembly protein OpcA
VPVVTWWHDAPPERIATDALGVVAERRITDVGQTRDPVASLRQRAEDYAPGDTDLAWTRTTSWRSLLAGALDTVTVPVVAVTVMAAEGDPVGELLRGWLQARLGIIPTPLVGGRLVQAVTMRLATGEEISIERGDEVALLHRTGLPERIVPLVPRALGDQLAEELRRLDADQPYAQALQAATGVVGLSDRPGSRVHIWYDPITTGASA